LAGRESFRPAAASQLRRPLITHESCSTPTLTFTVAGTPMPSKNFRVGYKMGTLVSRQHVFVFREFEPKDVLMENQVVGSIVALSY
jgi:hypothetical protein